MATLFQSFRSSSMPKRLLRYALSRLELLDAEALDMDNLDLAIGRNTVLEFRDVGIKLKKLNKLLQLPDTFKLRKAKVLLLRVTIPMDFYTSPIIVEVDGVDIALEVVGTESKPNRSSGTKTPEETVAVPNTVDLAQSFLETQPKSERQKLEDALAAETQDLGASVSMSDDGSEEDLAYGTGQALSLPAFLADFLQGIVDRMQVRIKGVNFQLDVEVPVEPNATTTEMVSFQVALEGIDVEGVTTRSYDADGSPTIVPKEGKRHVSLSNVRAYLISEANVFSALVRSPSVASPSLASSPAMTRNPPSRQTTSLSEGSLDEESVASSQASIRSHNQESLSFHTQQHEELAPSSPQHSIDQRLLNSSLSSLQDDDPLADSQQSFQEDYFMDHESPEHDYPLGDSEDALGIPYEFSSPQDDDAEDSPATPRASMYHDFNNESNEDSLFHSTLLPGEHGSHSTALENERPVWTNAEREARSAPNLENPINQVNLEISSASVPNEQLSRTSSSESFGARSAEDLAQSHMYTHQEAESMYMSAFSQTNAQPAAILSPSPPYGSSPSPHLPDEPVKEEEDLPEPSNPDTPDAKPDVQELAKSHTSDAKPPSPTVEDVPAVVEEEQRPKDFIPGAWDDDYDESPPDTHLVPSTTLRRSAYRNRDSDVSADASDSESSEPAFSRACLTDVEPGSSNTPPKQQDDVTTPKGPTRLVKEILNLKTISIYIPSQHQHLNVQPASAESVAQLSQSLGRSAYPQAPGAFSMHGAASTHQHHHSSGTSNVDDALEVNLSPINLRFDASLGFLLAMVVGKLLEAIKDKQTPPAQESRKESNAKKTPDVKITLDEIKLDFVNRLGGVSDTPERYMDPSAFIFDQEVLLNTTLQNLTISISQTEIATPPVTKGKLTAQPAVLTKIDLQKFRFGYANGDIISFDSGRPMSTSVRETFLSAGSDVSIKILQSGGNTKTEVQTLPLVFQLDLRRLDETFSWFGGLSSFLNMSASIASSPAPTPKTSTPAQKPRGVRFDTPVDPNDKSAAADNKINLRIGGAWVELVGKDCSMTAETSAIKIVSRDEVIGIACSVMRVSGPYLKNSTADPPISTEIGGVRIEFLTAPKDSDLERLLELIIPSKHQFDNDNDEIMVDTLLRQRRKGSVLRLTVDTVNVRVQNMSQLSVLPNLGEELAKLSTVAKYLPEDDRPGLLTLSKINKVALSLDFGGKLGHLGADIKDLHVGHISVPSLVALAVHDISVKRNHSEELVHSATYGLKEISLRSPVLMVRMIGDEIEPVVKLKMQDLCIEYRVPTIMDLLELGEDATPQDFEASLAASVANLGDQAHHALARQPGSPGEKSKGGKPMTLDIGFRDCLFGLNPLGQPSKMVIALTDAHLIAILPKDVETNAVFTINKSSILLINDVGDITKDELPAAQRLRASSSTSRQVADMCARGYVDICYISSAKVVIDVKELDDGEKQLNVELKDDLLVLETCADSTQTLISLANALKPPTPPSKENKYLTDVVPMQDLLASISAEAFGRPEGEYDFDQDFAGAQEMAGSGSEADFNTDSPLQVESQFYDDEPVAEELFDATSSSIISHGSHRSGGPQMKDTNEGVLLTGFGSASQQTVDSDDLAIQENYYDRGTSKDSNAKVWNSKKNSYDQAPSNLVKRSPVKISVRDVHVIWNLFDGYDWAHTRDVITKAVHDVEAKAYERQSRAGQVHVYEEELEDEEAIGDFLFNSIYIGIPANRDPQELSRAINEGLNDNATETESVATTAFTAATNRTARTRQPRSKRLKLKRSKHHKITFELQGVDADVFVFPPDSGETLNSIDVRINNLDVFDHVPTSTWKKFATYDQDMGEREMGTSMVHLEMLNVKPQPSLEASEIVLRATILPLRLHVDQDALDFITRFFEFKDDQVPVHTSKSDVPFLQRAEVNNVAVKLDFKPKRVDYAGLRSGHTTEFMNFIVLEEARMVLRHVIIYGISGFEKLGNTLNDIWMPDVKANQLPGILAGLAPVRSIVNVGSGFRDLVEVPIREYKKDGRIIRSISKGATAFARTTGTELVKFGAKLANGTQYALQSAEGMLSDRQQVYEGWDEDDVDPEEQRQISLYADQPTGVISGIRGGYRSLARDVNLVRDAIIAVPGEVMESSSASGAAKAVLKRAPTIIFRPAVGVTRAIGQTLMGATNSIDPNNRRRIEEKYKQY
ncbi:related to sporulation protein SPO72 [Fusarium torulosum]|uniref:Autophagy-related protein 2 n=1 Tax=Fusarium torulosum TaxID=33205 RepID=A0AAE8MK42_9HYPO|nr:related to sporulation protein SPO72 [Fusarium torulosum]